MIKKWTYFLVVCTMLHFLSQFKVDAANCANASGDPVTVKITLNIPQKYYLDSVPTNPWLGLTAAPSGDNDDNLNWTFGEFSFENGRNIGTLVRFGIDDWPSSGSFFGKKELKLEYLTGSGNCKDIREVKVFFPPLEVIDGEPAWYKYWQHKAVPELKNFDLSTKLALSIWLGRDRDVWGSHQSHYRVDYDVNDPSSFSLSLLASDYCIAEEAYAGEGGSNLNHTKKIDNIAEIIAHEVGHREYFIAIEKYIILNWWNALSEEAQVAYLSAKTCPALRRDIDALLNDQAVRNASEAFAMTKNADYASYVRYSEDWSKGGENDK